jgi:tetratricopeptide (TPR) repeat protein
MRLALVVAPSDPRCGDATARREALAWLRSNLARFGFHVVIVGGGADPQGDLARAVDKVSAGDTVLVHASGRLAGRDSLACGESRSVFLGTLSSTLAARGPAQVSFVVEFAHEEDPNDPLLATQCLDDAVRALGAKQLGYPVLAAVRPLAAVVDRVAFTRLTLPPPNDHAGPPPTETLVSSMYDRALATPESHELAQSFTFRRGAVPQAVPAEVLPEEAYVLDGPTALSLPPPPVADAEPESGPRPAVYASQAQGLSIHSQIAEATELRDWAQALLLRRHRLDTLGSPRQKARELVAIARILQVEYGDSDGALSALEMARAMDPQRASVLLALRRGYEKVGRWNSALEILSALAPLAPSPAERAAIRVAQARILLERVGDKGRAIEWLQSAVAEDPTHADALRLLAELCPPAEVDVDTLEKNAERLLAEGADDDALTTLESIAVRSPMRASVYEKQFASHWRSGRTDGAFLAALALEELDAADVDQQILIDQYRSVGPARARMSLDNEGWESLRAPGSDAVLEQLFAAAQPAAIAARVEELREKRTLVTLDPQERLSETSTASIGRTFQWAARLLSVQAPHLYVREGASRGIVPIQAREPSVALGPPAVSGLSAKDLAFLAGRQLTYYRPEYQVLLYYSTREDLTTLLLAAALFAMPAAAAAAATESVRGLRARLARHLDHKDHKDERAALEDAVRALDARGGEVALGAWMCSAELTAGRAGLLLCGDLATATALVRTEPREGSNVYVDTKRGDLVSFCSSRKHAAMRKRYTSTAPESFRPPPPPSAERGQSLEVR